MAFTYTPDGKQALFVGDVGQYGALSSPTKVSVNGVLTPISAAIETSSTTRGNVLPRMTNAQIGVIPVPTPGMEAFNTDTQAIAVYTTSGWIDQTGPTGTQYMSGVLTAAQIQGISAASISLIPAPGANMSIIVNRFVLELVSDGTAFGGGGNINLQYDTSAHAGTAATQVIPSSLLTATVNQMTSVSGSVVNAPTAAYVNKPVDITSAAAFTLGGASTVRWKIWFSKIPTA